MSAVPIASARQKSYVMRDAGCVMRRGMRTTLSIDDDIVAQARALSQRDGRTLGEVISDLARKGLERPVSGGTRNGIPLLAADRSTEVVTMELVSRLRDELP